MAYMPPGAYCWLCLLGDQKCEECEWMDEAELEEFEEEFD